MYLKGAGAAVVLYDVTEKSSFISAKSLVNQIQRRGEPNVVIALTGIVNEKNESKKTVVCDEAQEFALAHGLIFMEITLPTGHNIEMLFEEIGEFMISPILIFLSTKTTRINSDSREGTLSNRSPQKI